MESPSASGAAISRMAACAPCSADGSSKEWSRGLKEGFTKNLTMGTCSHPSPAIAANRHQSPASPPHRHIVTLLHCYMLHVTLRRFPLRTSAASGSAKSSKHQNKRSSKHQNNDHQNDHPKHQNNDHQKRSSKTKHQKENKTMSLILSEHFRLAEFTTSLVAVTRRIDNTPPLPAICNLQQLCLHVMEPLRAHLGHAVSIKSG